MSSKCKILFGGHTFVDGGLIVTVRVHCVCHKVCNIIWVLVRARVSTVR